MFETAPLLRPLHNQLISLLEGLSREQWLRPTLAKQWRVRDIVAHLIDTDLRRISAQRDGYHGPPPSEPIDSYGNLVAFLNELNRVWVRAYERLSTQVLLDLVRQSGSECAQVLEAVDPLSRAMYPVAWANEQESLAWMDVGRVFTEKWHHQQQIRDAVGAPLLLEERWTRPLFELSVRALPRAYADMSAPDGTVVGLIIEGEGGGNWLLSSTGTRWELSAGVGAPDTTVRMTTDQAWRLLYNALSPDQVAHIQVEGDKRWVKPLLGARSVMV
ncbi:MAG TPA: maleylpyruvate isomerase N-terminal domain-containing protein [Longimicrobiales bacterium]|nr:maleylpyruvate isomerase N-terminal domain-containing protein [Longimicrobiales bacterium]